MMDIALHLKIAAGGELRFVMKLRDESLPQQSLR